MIKLFRIYWKSLLVAIVIAYGSLTSGENLPESSLLSIPHADKIMHALMYAALSLLILAANKRLEIQNNQAYTITFAILYGSCMEWLQMTLTQTRQGELLDIVANLTGVLLGWILFKFLGKKRWLHYL